MNEGMTEGLLFLRASIKIYLTEAETRNVIPVRLREQSALAEISTLYPSQQNESNTKGDEEQEDGDEEEDANEEEAGNVGHLKGKNPLTRAELTMARTVTSRKTIKPTQ